MNKLLIILFLLYICGFFFTFTSDELKDFSLTVRLVLSFAWPLLMLFAGTINIYFYLFGRFFK